MSVDVYENRYRSMFDEEPTKKNLLQRIYRVRHPEDNFNRTIKQLTQLLKNEGISVTPLKMLEYIMFQDDPTKQELRRLLEKFRISNDIKPQGDLQQLWDHLDKYLQVHVAKQHGYYLVEQLGRGKYGEVWLSVKDQQLFTIKVIQILSEPHARLIQSEIQILQRIKQLCPLKRFACLVEDFNLNGLKYIVLEYIPGENLQKVLEYRFRYNLTDQMLRSILIQLRYLVEKIHQLEVIHRDIKPANLIYNIANNRLYLIDFGLSCFEPECTEKFRGTRIYAPPYLTNDMDFRMVDIYSMGVTFFAILTGKRLFTGIDYDDLQMNQYSFARLEQTSLQESLKDLIAGMTQVDPQDRWTIDEIGRKLLSIHFVPSDFPILDSSTQIDSL